MKCKQCASYKKLTGYIIQAGLLGLDDIECLGGATAEQPSCFIPKKALKGS